MVGVEGTWGTPLARSGWWGVPGVPQPDMGGGGREYLGYPLGQVWMVGVPGVPPNQVWMVGVGSTWGTPQPGLDGGGVPGVSPNQVWMVG